MLCKKDLSVLQVCLYKPFCHSESSKPELDFYYGYSINTSTSLHKLYSEHITLVINIICSSRPATRSLMWRFQSPKLSQRTNPRFQNQIWKQLSKSIRLGFMFKIMFRKLDLRILYKKILNTLQMEVL